MPAPVLKVKYCNYCCFLFQYNQNTEVKEYLEKLLDELREKHVVFDLEALLIKPVQRILKYPLLLNALFKVRGMILKYCLHCVYMNANQNY